MSDDICTEGQDKLVKFVGVVFVVGLLALLLCGCGESVSEYHQNEKRDQTLRDVEKDTYTTHDRLQALEGRISVLERAAQEQKP